MSTSDQDEIFEVLEKQRQNQLKVDRILKIVLPIVGFLLSTICANLNWQSTLGTFIMLTLAMWAVSIWRLSLWMWMLIAALYCLVDNYFSYGTLQLSFLRLQLGCMLFFIGLAGIGRPYMDRWLLSSSK
ncbi:hypothetical protein [uncultured Acinetobacter sp.]|uniref:hypothetical protein n=1 Tax=uncultured Acinetobacter sp. TaxID=165433 RepID=UPI00258C0391|nr:hypothetical protein [uncultured Acinetobacter sp.]